MNNLFLKFFGLYSNKVKLFIMNMEFPLYKKKKTKTQNKTINFKTA